MSEPELWTRCPKAKPTWIEDEWACPCHGTSLNGSEAGLVRVPFDGAVERMCLATRGYKPDPTAADDEREFDFMAHVLRAALGEDT